MADALTSIFSLTKPEVNVSTTWPTSLNADLDSLDDLLARPKQTFNSPVVGATTTCDLSLARVFVFTVSQATSLAFTNVPSASFAVRIRLLVTNGSAFVLTFPASVSWLTGIAPSFKASGVDELEMMTKDGGTTWYATLRNVRPGLIYQNQGQSTVSAVDASIGSYSLPANTLAVNAQAIRIFASGTSSGSTGGNVTIKFGATTLITFAFTNGQVWRVDALVTRSGAATQFNNSFALVGVTPSHSNTGPTETLSGAITIDFRGNVTGGGTLSLNTSSVEYRAVG